MFHTYFILSFTLKSTRIICTQAGARAALARARAALALQPYRMDIYNNTIRIVPLRLHISRLEYVTKLLESIT